MAKIKFKKEMTLPELIKWGWDNKTIGRFEGDKGSLVLFDANSWVVSNKFVCSEETFEVEIEEEIDEDTVIPKLIQVLEYNDNTDVILNENKSINTVFDESLDDLLYMPKTFYMLNDDMTMTLIWRNGGMVE